MKKTVCAFKNHSVVFILLIFNAILSVVGIILGVAAFKLDQFDNPFLKVVPVTAFCWIIVPLLFKHSRKMMTLREYEEVRSKELLAVENGEAEYAEIPVGVVNPLSLCTILSYQTTSSGRNNIFNNIFDHFGRYYYRVCLVDKALLT